VAPRAYWKGYLKLSLVSCPVALFPASSEREKISFNQINKKTGNRIKYRKIDAETEEEVDSSDIIKGYEVGKGQYIEIDPEELEAIAIESKDMLELAAHIVETKSGHFEPEKFEDHYEDALKELLKKKQAGEKIEAPKERAPAKVINLMDALRRSVETERGGKRQAPSAKARGSDSERQKKKKSR
jgi:non-homologous end joining protein Ku